MMKYIFKCFSAKTKPEDIRSTSQAPPIKQISNFTTAINVSQINYKDEASDFASTLNSNHNQLHKKSINGPKDYTPPYKSISL